MTVEGAYAFLGVPPADMGKLERLKARFRKLCLAFHPDKNRGRETEAAAAFTYAHAAYHFLTTTNFDYERWKAAFVVPPLQSLEEVLMLALGGADPEKVEDLLRKRGEYRPHPEFGINLSIPWAAGTQEEPSFDVSAGSAYTSTRPLGNQQPTATLTAGGGGASDRSHGSGATGEGEDALLVVEEPSPVTHGPSGLELAVVEAPQVRALGLHAPHDEAFLAHRGGSRASLGGDLDRRPWEEAALQIGPAPAPARTRSYVPPALRPDVQPHSSEAAAVADEYNARSLLAFKEKHWQMCYDCASEAIRLQPLKVAYYGNRAAAALKLRGPSHLRQAVADGLRACELDPTYARGHARAAEAYLGLGEKATVLAAIDHFERAMTLAPDNAAYREAHGRACVIYESDYALL